jgi:hypothetical protein
LVLTANTANDDTAMIFRIRRFIVPSCETQLKESAQTTRRRVPAGAIKESEFRFQ